MSRDAATPLRRYAVLVISALAAGRAEGQVGHDPARTPYSDVRNSVFIVASGGYFFGNGGDAGVAPHDGPVFGLRMSFLANKTVAISGGMFYGLLGVSSMTPQPADKVYRPSTTRSSGSAVISIHAQTWHRLAPYVGSGIGMAIVEDLPGTSFNLGTKFTFSPLVGVRWFLTDALAVQAESRFQFWNIKYTAGFAQEILESSEWSVTPWINIGLAIAWPF
jgi:opacity protein-like surface antigen